MRYIDDILFILTHGKDLLAFSRVFIALLNLLVNTLERLLTS